MRSFSSLEEVEVSKMTALTVGNFDGLHRGHQALLNATLNAGLSPALLTFEPHPSQLFEPSRPFQRLYRLEDKRKLLAQAGISLLVEQRFDARFAALSPTAFLEQLRRRLRPKLLVVGHDFRYGAQRAGSWAQLQEAGLKTQQIPALKDRRGEVISSSLIRAQLRRGEVEEAWENLGRPYHLRAEVQTGARRGRLLGFPTANLSPTRALLPQAGVYGAWLDWGEGPQAAVVNLGHHPTFGALKEPLIEAHVIHLRDLRLYGLSCSLSFAFRLREERRFSSLESLKARIQADRDEAAWKLAQLETPESWL